MQILTLVPTNTYTATFTGPTVEVAPDVDQRIRFFASATSVTGASASAAIKIFDSADGVNWVDTGVSLTLNSTTPAASNLTSAWGRYFQAQVTITGTTPVFTNLNITAIGN